MTIYRTSIFLTTILFLSCGTVGNNKSAKHEQLKAIINSDSTLQTGWYYIIDTDNEFKRQLDKDTMFYFIDPTPIITAKNIKAFEIYESNYGDIGLSMQLDGNGTIAWSAATNKATGIQLAFIVDNKLMQTAKVNSQNTGGITALNRNVYTRQELKEIQKLIEN